MLTAKQMMEFKNIIKGIIASEKNPFPLMLTAKVNSVQSTTLTATVIGETSQTSGIPFTQGATFNTNDIVFIFTSQSQNVSGWLAFKVAQ